MTRPTATPRRKIKYRRCDRNGCYVEMAVDNTLIESLARSPRCAAAKVNISADNGKTYALTSSLKGFSGAHDEMVSEARAKAKSDLPARRCACAAPAVSDAVKQIVGIRKKAGSRDRPFLFFRPSP